MNFYIKKPIVVKAITFDDLVAYGTAHVKTLVNGVPWSFTYEGHGITHENDDCYLIPTPEGVMKFTRGDMLITGVAGEIYPCKIEIFNKTYALAEGYGQSEIEETLPMLFGIMKERQNTNRRLRLEPTPCDRRANDSFSGLSDAELRKLADDIMDGSMS